MRVYVTGATGVIGRRAVPLLVAEGHEVTALVRSPAGAARMEAAGARPHTFDLFDRAQARRAFADHDAVINLATHVPRSTVAMLMPGAWRENDSIRREASATLAAAAREAGVERFVQESFAPIYPDRGDEWIDESTPVLPVRYNLTVVNAEDSAARFTEAGGTGVVLRFAGFYGPHDTLVKDAIRSIRRGYAPLPGPAEAYFSMISHADAASAVAAALRVPAGCYNVADDLPLRRGELAASVARLLGAREPRALPAWLPKLMGSMGEMIVRSLRISNRKLAATSGWSPAYPSAREGWAAALGEMGLLAAS